MKLLAQVTRCSRLMVLASALGACSSIPEEYQPIIDSLHTPEMEAAIKAARKSHASGPPPAENRSP